MAERFEVKFKEEIEKMEKYVHDNLEQATVSMEKATEIREGLQFDLTHLQEEIDSFRKEFFKVSKEIAIMAITKPKSPYAIEQIIKPILNYIDCAKKFYEIQGKLNKAKNHETNAKRILEEAKADFARVSAIREKEEG